MGAFVSLFSRTPIKISNFTGVLKELAAAGDNEHLWDDDWDDSDDWEDDGWEDDDWEDDDWEDDDWDDLDSTIIDSDDSAAMYKKIVKRVKINRDPIIIEYSLWWLWLTISGVVIAGAAVTFFVIRKKKKNNKTE